MEPQLHEVIITRRYGQKDLDQGARVLKVATRMADEYVGVCMVTQRCYFMELVP